MGDALEKGFNVAFVRESVLRALLILPASEFPLLRAKLGESTTASDDEIRSAGQEEWRGEVMAAIRKRLEERG